MAAQADGVDPSFEFDAPRYYNFETMEPESPSQTDAWFDTAGPTGMASPLNLVEGNAMEAEGPACATAMANASERAMEAETASPLESATAIGAAAAEQLAEEAGHSTEIGAAPDIEVADATNVGNVQVAAQQTAEPPVAIPRPVKVPSNLVTSWGGAPAKRVLASSQGAAASGFGQPDASAGAAQDAQAPVKRTGFVMPRAPRVHVPAMPKSPRPGLSTRMRTQAQTTDVVQAAKAQEEADVVAQQRQQNEHSKQIALRPRNSVPKRMSTKPLTEPKAPALQTSKRHKAAEAEPHKGRVSPKRPRTRSQMQSRSQITEPKPPNLATSLRARPTQCKSREQLEEEEMAAIPKFHARPVNPAILSGEGAMGLPHVEARPLTTSQPFDLATDKRSTPQQAWRHAEPSTSFRALPLDHRILQGPTFQPQRPQHNPIVSRAPSFATEARALVKRPGEQPFVFSATNSAGSDRVETRSMKLRQSSPTPRSFNLVTELRGKAAEAAKQEALQRKEEEERRARDFHAHPVPAHVHRPAPLPRAVDPVFTMPEPFKLESESRHKEARVLQEMRNQQELERQQRHTQFKAQPVPKAKEFKVAKSDRFLTVPDGFELLGDKRSRERAQFDAALAEKEYRQQEEQALAEAQRKRQEKAEIKAHRKTLQFKANPVPHYSSRAAAVQLPPPQWTEPVSPKLATNARAATRRRLA